MNAIVLDEIAMRFEPAALLKRLRMDASDPDAPQPLRLLEDAQRIARPKAVYGVAFIDSRDGDTIGIDGVAFGSRVLRVNTEQTHRVWPFLATCGAELADWARSLDDMLECYWADEIMHMALHAARQALNEALAREMPLDQTAVMNPGSLADWPIEQQRPLFQLLGEAAERIGVRLTESLLMVPTKTVSGIRFATEARFENCQLCPRAKCPGRRAPYDKDLYARRYAGAASDEHE